MSTLWSTLCLWPEPTSISYSLSVPYKQLLLRLSLTPILLLCLCLSSFCQRLDRFQLLHAQYNLAHSLRSVAALPDDGDQDKPTAAVIAAVDANAQRSRHALTSDAQHDVRKWKEKRIRHRGVGGGSRINFKRGAEEEKSETPLKGPEAETGSAEARKEVMLRSSGEDTPEAMLGVGQQKGQQCMGESRKRRLGLK